MRSIIFDLDGTLLDSRKGILESIRFALEEVSFADLPIDEANAVTQDLGTTIRQAAEKVSVSFDEFPFEKFIATYRDHHNHESIKSIEVFPHVRDVLSNLRENFEFAVATTKHSDQAKHILKAFDLDHYFKWIQGTDPGLRYKPAPDILLKTLEQTRRVAADAVYVGDSIHDMRAAAAATMKRIAACYGFTCPISLQDENPDAILHSIHELPDRLASIF